MIRNDRDLRVEQQAHLRHRRAERCRAASACRCAARLRPPDASAASGTARACITAGTWKPSCNRPLTNTPMASATPGFAVCGAIHSATMIMTTFMITCVYAGSANLAVAVEHAGEQRAQRDEEQIGEGPAQHRHREVATCRRSACQPGANARMMSGAAITPSKVTKNSTTPKVPATASTSSRTSSCGRLHLVFADDRHEGLRERAFGEQAAQEVRDLERHQPGVHEGAGAEGLRIDHVAGQAGDTRHQRGHTDHGRALENRSAHPASTRKIKEKLRKARTIPDSLRRALTRWGSVSTLRGLQNDPGFLEIPSWRIPSRLKKPPVELRPTALATWRCVRACARPCARSTTPWPPATRPMPSAALKDAQPVIDSLVNKNVIHRNKAARHKSALSARIKAMPARSNGQDFGASQERGARKTRPSAGFFVSSDFLLRAAPRSLALLRFGATSARLALGFAAAFFLGSRRFFARAFGTSRRALPAAAGCPAPAPRQSRESASPPR